MLQPLQWTGTLTAIGDTCGRNNDSWHDQRIQGAKRIIVCSSLGLYYIRCLGGTELAVCVGNVKVNERHILSSLSSSAWAIYDLYFSTCSVICSSFGLSRLHSVMSRLPASACMQVQAVHYLPVEPSLSFAAIIMVPLIQIPRSRSTGVLSCRSLTRTPRFSEYGIRARSVYMYVRQKLGGPSWQKASISACEPWSRGTTSYVGLILRANLNHNGKLNLEEWPTLLRSAICFARELLIEYHA